MQPQEEGGTAALQVRGNEQVNVRHPSGNSRTRPCGKQDAKEGGDAYCDQVSEQKIVKPEAVRQELLEQIRARYWTTRTLRQQAGVEPERLLQLSRRVALSKFLSVQ